MRPSPAASFFVLLTSLLCLLLPARLTAQPEELRQSGRNSLALQNLAPGHSSSLIAMYHSRESADADTEKLSDNDQKGGIREIIPNKYLARYREWKNEFLSAETGREQWAMFEHNPRFTLTITVSPENSRGAGTGEYKWDDSGKLTAATITLGSSLNEGYPSPIYFPVMSSLAPAKSFFITDADVLAAAKIAHEFGHLTRTANSDSRLYQLQSQLMGLYNKILLGNGRNTADPRLIVLAQQMGGTPVEIWEDREYWGETNTMLYLRDRFAEDSLRCALFSRIKQSVNLYAQSYTERFLTVAKSTPSTNRCGWQ